MLEHPPRHLFLARDLRALRLLRRVELHHRDRQGDFPGDDGRSPARQPDPITLPSRDPASARHQARAVTLGGVRISASASPQGLLRGCSACRDSHDPGLPSVMRPGLRLVRLLGAVAAVSQAVRRSCASSVRAADCPNIVFRIGSATRSIPLLVDPPVRRWEWRWLEAQLLRLPTTIPDEADEGPAESGGGFEVVRRIDDGFLLVVGAAPGVLNLSSGKFVPLAISPMSAVSRPGRALRTRWLLGLAGSVWEANQDALARFATVPLRGSLSPLLRRDGVAGTVPWTLVPFRTEGPVEVLRDSHHPQPLLPKPWREVRKAVDDVLYDDATGAVVARAGSRVIVGTREGGPRLALRPAERREPASLSRASTALVCFEGGCVLHRVSDGNIVGTFQEVQASVSPDGRRVAGWSDGYLRVSDVERGHSVALVRCTAVRGLTGPSWSDDSMRVAALARFDAHGGDWIVVADLATRSVLVTPSYGDTSVAL